MNLANLAFIAEGTVKVIAAMDSNMTADVEEARVVISKEMVQKVMI